jgi:hypothetical protein
MARRLVAPDAWSAFTVGPMSAALASARCCRTAVERARIFAVGCESAPKWDPC